MLWLLSKHHTPYSSLPWKQTTTFKENASESRVISLGRECYGRPTLQAFSECPALRGSLSGQHQWVLMSLAVLGSHSLGELAQYGREKGELLPRAVGTYQVKNTMPLGWLLHKTISRSGNHLLSPWYFSLRVLAAGVQGYWILLYEIPISFLHLLRESLL